MQRMPVAPAVTNLASSGYAYDPVQRKYSQIQGTLPSEDENYSLDPATKLATVGANKVIKHTGAAIFGSKDNPGMKLAGGGGISDAHYNLGGYSDGGRLLRGPGDGVSDSIPAVIGKKQPARLADGEFVVPARIVSELGNGSTEAGARKLYAMMDRIQKARGSTVGRGRVAKNSKAEKYLPA